MSATSVKQSEGESPRIHRIQEERGENTHSFLLSNHGHLEGASNGASDGEPNLHSESSEHASARVAGKGEPLVLDELEGVRVDDATSGDCEDLDLDSWVLGLEILVVVHLVVAGGADRVVVGGSRVVPKTGVRAVELHSGEAVVGLKASIWTTVLAPAVLGGISLGETIGLDRVSHVPSRQDVLDGVVHAVVSLDEHVAHTATAVENVVNKVGLGPALFSLGHRPADAVLGELEAGGVHGDGGQGRLEGGGVDGVA